MELQPYLSVLRRRAILIIIVTILTVTVITIASQFITPMYAARATLRVMQDVGVQDLSIRETYGERLMNTYSRILTSWPVLEQASQRLGGRYSASQLRAKVSVEVLPETELMRIAVRDHDRYFATELANMLADLLIEHVQNLYVGSNELSDQLERLGKEIESDRQKLVALATEDPNGPEATTLARQIEFKEDSYDQLLDRYELTLLNESLRANSVLVVEPAKQPSAPYNLLGLRDIVIGFIVGLVGGVGLALVVENIDTRIHSSQKLESLTRLPVLGQVPRGLLSLEPLRDADGTISSTPIGEAYRLLGLNLLTLREEKAVTTLLITSAMPKEGKSMVAANLVRVLAERGRTIYLIEADLRRPSQQKLLKAKKEINLHDLLTNHQSMIEFLALLERIDGLGFDDLLGARAASEEGWSIHTLQCPGQPRLFVIPAGEPASSPTMLLASPAMAILLDRIKSQGNLTILDAPPVLGVADVSVMGPMVGGVILLVRQGVTKREQLLAALKQLQASRANVLGFVFIQKSRRDWSY